MKIMMELIFDGNLEKILENFDYFNYIKYKIKNIDYYYFINNNVKDDINKNIKILFERTEYFHDFNTYQKTDSYNKIINKYDWVIHYNLNNLLCEPNFIKYFFSIKTNLFINYDFKDLYIVSNKTLLDYNISDNKNIVDFVKNSKYKVIYSIGNILIKNDNGELFYI